jgi:hypothetical protein
LDLEALAIARQQVGWRQLCRVPKDKELVAELMLDYL